MTHRNPIGVNLYMQPIHNAWASISEIASGEAHNFTSEHGPREPKVRKVKKK